MTYLKNFSNIEHNKDFANLRGLQELSSLAPVNRAILKFLYNKLPMIVYKETPNGILLNIFVQPKSSRNQIAGEYKNSLKIRLTNPPADNAANKACVKFLAKEFNIAKSDIEIIKGGHSKQKQILIKKIDIKELESFLNRKS